VTVKCWTAIKVLFLYFNLCSSVMLNSLSNLFISIESWHLLGHAIKSVICFHLQFSCSTRPMMSFCIFIAYIHTEGILYVLLGYSLMHRFNSLCQVIFFLCTFIFLCQVICLYWFISLWPIRILFLYLFISLCLVR
jgi:hypothetical protein